MGFLHFIFRKRKVTPQESPSPRAQLSADPLAPISENKSRAYTYRPMSDGEVRPSTEGHRQLRED